MITTIANNKGGVGKTTLAIHFATWLADKGKRVVLLDMDTQGSVARFLGLEPADDLAQLFHAALILRPDLRPNIRKFLTIVPGYPLLALVRGWEGAHSLEVALHQPGARPAVEVLKEAIAPLLAVPDIELVFDTGPHAGTLQQAAIAVADHVFVPAIPEAASEPGIIDISRHLAQLGRGITGVIPTRHTLTVVNGAYTGEHHRRLRDWQKALHEAVYYNPEQHFLGLPNRIIWGKIVGYGRPIWTVAPYDIATREMTIVVRRMADDAEIKVAA